jgi:actin related protein 2/3 complex subunit 1A/1B
MFCCRTPTTPFGSKLVFGDLFAEIESPSCGWVQSVKWSPSGNQLGFVSQDSALTVSNISTGTPQTQSVRFAFLPFRDLIWLNETGILAAGNDCNPTLFQNNGGWKLVKKLDVPAGAAASKTANNNAFQVWNTKIEKGDGPAETKLETKHQNCITCICAHKSAGGSVTHYSTSGLDGNLGMWEFK